MKKDKSDKKNIYIYHIAGVGTPSGNTFYRLRWRGRRGGVVHGHKSTAVPPGCIMIINICQQIYYGIVLLEMCGQT